MSRFFETKLGDETYHCFVTDEGASSYLDEDNLGGHFHEELVDDEIVPTEYYLYDRVLVITPESEPDYVFWRFDMEEEFDYIEQVARKVGTYLCRHTVLPSIQMLFEADHPFTDEDFEKLLEAEDE